MSLLVSEAGFGRGIDKVTVLPKLAYWRERMRVCRAVVLVLFGSEYESVERHLVRRRVPWDLERRTSRLLAGDPPPTPFN